MLHDCGDRGAVEDLDKAIKDLRDFGHQSGTRRILVCLVLSTLVDVAMLGVVIYFTTWYCSSCVAVV